MTHLLIKTWGGSSADLVYIHRSLGSLLASDLPNDVKITIYDDASPNQEFLSKLRELAVRHRIQLIEGGRNLGPNKAQEVLGGLMYRSLMDEDFFVTADDDVLYHPGWFRKLRYLYQTCRYQTDAGVFSSINMRFRPAHQRLIINGQRVLLKHRQPAVNWLIPQETYQLTGPFEDEGVAWDTSFCHRLRLLGRPIACMSPSYVQNIGFIGAYATDDTMFALDYIGDPKLKRFAQSVNWHRKRLLKRARAAVDTAATVLAPVRWGCEMVYEGSNKQGECVLVDNLGEHEARGVVLDGVLDRVVKVSAALAREGGSGPKLRRSLKGWPVQIEHPWHYQPHVRELHRYRSVDLLLARKLLIGILTALIPLHKHGVVHNKVRPENVFVDKNDEVRLAWAGIELPTGTDCFAWDAATARKNLVWAVSRWTDSTVRARHCADFLSSVAPEVAMGRPSTLRSDVYSAAATVCQLLPPSDVSADGSYASAVARLHIRNRLWLSADDQLHTAINLLLEPDPCCRPRSAVEALSALEVTPRKR